MQEDIYFFVKELIMYYYQCYLIKQKMIKNKKIIYMKQKKDYKNMQQLV